jgi:uncharacterized protein YndB with AHSA1/START domain
MIASTADSTDRIEDEVRLPQPQARVWRALTNPTELGAWFGVDLTGATIAPGARVNGRFTIPGHEHHSFDVTIETVEPERRFAWRWHPSASDASVDMSKEPRTLVTFTLESTPDGGTLLRVVETGFSGLAAARRTASLLGNTKGWQAQLHTRLSGYLASAT